MLLDFSKMLKAPPFAECLAWDILIAECAFWEPVSLTTIAGAFFMPKKDDPFDPDEDGSPDIDDLS